MIYIYYRMFGAQEQEIVLKWTFLNHLVFLHFFRNAPCLIGVCVCGYDSFMTMSLWLLFRTGGSLSLVFPAAHSAVVCV